MKRYTYFGLFFTFLSSVAYAQEETIEIPDVAFEEALIDLKIDTNGLNGNILVSDAQYAVNLDLSDPKNNKMLPNVHSKIKSLAGIEHFENLRQLNCYGNEITELNLSNNKKLSFLNCSQNKIKSLDLSNNSGLTFVNCSENNLRSLELGKKEELRELYCNSNKIKELNIRDCPVLEIMDSSDNNSIETIFISPEKAEAIPESWSKGDKGMYVAIVRKEATKPDTKVATKQKESETKQEEEKNIEDAKESYSKDFKRSIIAQYDKSVLDEKYLQTKKEQLQKEYDLDMEQLTEWIDKYSKVIKLKKEQ